MEIPTPDEILEKEANALQVKIIKSVTSSGLTETAKRQIVDVWEERYMSGWIAKGWDVSIHSYDTQINTYMTINIKNT